MFQAGAISLSVRLLQTNEFAKKEMQNGRKHTGFRAEWKL